MVWVVGRLLENIFLSSCGLKLCSNSDIWGKNELDGGSRSKMCNHQLLPDCILQKGLCFERRLPPPACPNPWFPRAGFLVISVSSLVGTLLVATQRFPVYIAIGSIDESRLLHPHYCFLNCVDLNKASSMDEVGFGGSKKSSWTYIHNISLCSLSES